jgi:FkbM family methyltransferase
VLKTGTNRGEATLRGRWLPGVLVGTFQRLQREDRRFLARVIGRFRRVLVEFYDPDVTVAIADGNLTIPLSHDLPFTRAVHPGYSENLRRTIECLADEQPACQRATVVDVGANVGDSVVLTNRSDVRFICIEGHPGFYEYLVHNTGHMENVTPVLAMVGAPGHRLSISTSNGTGSPDHTNSGVEARSLADIVGGTGRPQPISLLKVDTDGYDAEILESSFDWIRAERPTLFFEYDPSMQPDDAKPIRQVVAELVEMGYRWLLVSGKEGDLMVAVEGDDVMDDLDLYVRRGQQRYFDICMTDDEGRFSRIRAAEHRAFAVGAK